PGARSGGRQPLLGRAGRREREPPPAPGLPGHLEGGACRPSVPGGRSAVSTAWRYTSMILAGAALLLVVGFYSVRMGLAASRAPRERLATEKIFRQLGGEPGLAAKKRTLTALKAQLERERAAHRSDAGAFSRRIEETFAELGLTLTSSSEWKPVPKLKLPG